ncbi:hypothetical protein HanRHA438_Chr13g0620651 [Helianthus annuus]|nr:hypothetical protein HanRHA438_Chr13g0620651 [Helianthus annuus]
MVQFGNSIQQLIKLDNRWEGSSLCHFIEQVKGMIQVGNLLIPRLGTIPII